jgi:hypothetical protein
MVMKRMATENSLLFILGVFGVLAVQTVSF